jgi:chemotaxis protein MotB
MARRKRQEETISQSWLTTYGDMVTLLLTFFVFLFAFSTLDVQKFQKLILSFQGAIGVLPGGKTTQPDDQIFQAHVGVDAGEVRKQTQDILDVARRVQTLVREEGLEGEVTVRVDQRGVTISMTEQVLYASGSAEIRPEGKRLLAKIGMILKDVQPPIAVEGHTDSVPLRGGVFGDNWGLSAARAAAVVSYFGENVGIDPKRLQAVGFGQYRPLVPNDTDEHRALNRRVDVVLLSQFSQ